MRLKDHLERVRVLLEGTALDSAFPPAYPPAAVEIAPDRITGVRVVRDRRSRRASVRAAVSRDLPAGSVEASLVRPNIVEPAAVGRALDEVLRAVAPGEHRVSLLIPDPAARVSILGFPSLPGTRREVNELVRFRMAKALPFKAEDAVLDLMPLGGPVGTTAGPSGVSLLAVFMHRPILEQYESLLTARGYWPGLVALASLEMFNLFRPRVEAGPGDKDVLFLDLTRRYLAILILSGERLIFYRSKALPMEAADADLAPVRREIYTSLAFYQEKLLGRGIGRTLLRSADRPFSPVAEAVGQETGGPVEALRLAEVLHLGDPATLPDEAAGHAAPAAAAAHGRRA